MPSTSTAASLMLGAADQQAPATLFGRAIAERMLVLDSLAAAAAATTTTPTAATSSISSLLGTVAETTSATISRDYFAASALASEPTHLAAAAAGNMAGGETQPVTILYTFEELGHWTTDNRVTALLHALLASFSVILVSELGDKTFIITAIMAMKNSRSLVFLSSASALLIMTILSVGMGVAATVIPELYTHYASIVLFLCFGLKMLKESWDMAPNAAGDESEFEEVKRSLEQQVDAETEVEVVKVKVEALAGEQRVQRQQVEEGSEQQVALSEPNQRQQQRKWHLKLIETLHIAPIVFKVFTMVFVAEWGDRSQISTVILAAREDSAGVFIGSLSGHVFCTGLAVIGGRFVADMISVRTMTLLGGIIFLFFAVFALLTGPGMS